MTGVAGAAVVGAGSEIVEAGPEAGESKSTDTECALALKDFQPRSMLKVKETRVPRSRFPVIDFHTHLTFVRRGEDGSLRAKAEITPEQALKVMDAKNVAAMVNLTGGYGPALEEALNVWQKPHPKRFPVFAEPWFSRIQEANYSQILADEIEKAAKAGAKGVKVLKTLGLFLRERGKEGPLVAVDDPRFDPMWEVAGAYNLPVAIHTSDPLAFFLPTDRFNERQEELSAHPDWSFYGDFPPDQELQEARLRVMKRHPKTTFVGLHIAVAEDLDFVSKCLDECPNMFVEMGARVGELGRQPRRSKRFFEENQDRILFGTDAVPNGYETPQQIFGEELYEIYYRFLETDDEYFDYAPAEIPPQGRWRIYGVDLDESILKKVYYDNAARLLGWDPLDA
ncbi:MAG: amidohydrolase family protein [Acidobacteriota bacterium]|nr:MAG: amidohydrolase family protein [Acidobacteriota bacterium]